MFTGSEQGQTYITHLLWVREVVVDLLVEDVEDHIQEVPAVCTRMQY
jgi:hypothetical protein